MSDKWITWGQRGAIAIAMSYAAFLVFAGPIATVYPSFSEPARFAGPDATATHFSYGGTETPHGFRFEAEMTSVAFDRLADRLFAPQDVADAPLCLDTEKADRPKVSMPYQCAFWEDGSLVIEQKLSADDDAIRQIHRLTHASGQLVWILQAT